MHNLSAEHVVSIDVGRHHSTDTASIKEIVHALHTVERFSISEHGRLGPRVPFHIVVRSGEPYRYTVRAYAGTERAVLEVIGDYLGETGVQMQSRTLGAVLKRAGVAVP